jgi:hypothetical protein
MSGLEVLAQCASKSMTEEDLFRAWWKGDDANLPVEEAWKKWKYVKKRTYGGRMEDDDIREEAATGAPPDYVVWTKPNHEPDLEFINDQFTILDGTTITKKEFFRRILRYENPSRFHIHLRADDWESNTLQEYYVPKK